MLQSILFVPGGLPQYGVNVTTLLVPLFAIQALANRLIPSNTAYRDLQYNMALALSSAYHSGIVVCVAFWALYGAGFGTPNLYDIAWFAVSYALVALVQMEVDLALLALAKQIGRRGSGRSCRQPLMGMLPLITTMAVGAPVLLKRCIRFC
ncbi:energy-coupling factor ABC transporter permease [Bradyrhizobium canariense]|uniref:energy-coupling factor ABC transporter permease n=1 Tax=Bradyrhizobium canariense TaxID=255045 RepID=UPI00308386FC